MLRSCIDPSGKGAIDSYLSAPLRDRHAYRLIAMITNMQQPFTKRERVCVCARARARACVLGLLRLLVHLCVCVGGGGGEREIAKSASPPVCLSTVPPPLNVLTLSLSLGCHIKSLAQCFPSAIIVSYDFLL